MTNAPLILITNIWITIATITPHYNGETNFDSTVLYQQRAEWIQKEIHITYTKTGRRVETEVESNQIVNKQPDTPISRHIPFWYGGDMYRFTPTNAPERLTILPFRTRQEFQPIPQPPLPPK